MMQRLVAIIIAALVSISASAAQSTQHEALHLHQRPSGRVTAHFAFAQSIAESQAHALDDIARGFGIDEMALSFTQGTRCDSIATKVGCRPPGVVLWAWMRNNHSISSVDTRWSALTNALAGTFCASLNFITPENSAEPQSSFTHSSVNSSLSSLRYASLPREITCTENLTPWSKLLPCSTKAGIASLFNAYAIYDADYHSMSVEVSRKCTSDTECTTEIRQDLVVALDPVRKGYQRNMDWSLQFLFGKEVAGSCPLNEIETNILVTLPKAEGFEFEGKVKPVYNDEKNAWVYSLELAKQFSMGVKYSESKPDLSEKSKSTELIQIHRHLTGYGRERGGIKIRISNRDTKPRTVTLLEVLPWFIKLYMHTLQRTTYHIASQDVLSLSGEAANQTLKYQPAIPRIRPSVIELTATLPSESITVFTFDFDRAFIKYTEHPPDANRGFDTGAAILTVHPASRAEKEYRLFSDVLLIALPTPDFSMPYNVITMSCTIVALYFGTVFNLIVKKLEGLDDSQLKKKWWMFWVKERSVLVKK